MSFVIGAVQLAVQLGARLGGAAHPLVAEAMRFTGMGAVDVIGALVATAIVAVTVAYLMRAWRAVYWALWLLCTPLRIVRVRPAAPPPRLRRGASPDALPARRAPTAWPFP